MKEYKSEIIKQDLNKIAQMLIFNGTLTECQSLVHGKMKILGVFFTTILLILAGCENEKTSTDVLITVDVTRRNFPHKELILQDFMEVDYITLETIEGFYNQGFVQDVGNELLILRNRVNDGYVYIYNRTGKALRKFNQQGRGPGEYTSIYKIVLDEDNEEIFISDIHMRKILIYDLYGFFKRSFSNNVDSVDFAYSDFFNYDKDNLICYNRFDKNFAIVSKHDGSVTKIIEIPFKEKKDLQQLRQDGEYTYSVRPGFHSNIFSFNDNWLLSEHSSDTVYKLLTDYSLLPFIVRTPSIQSINPEIFLVLRLFSDRYYFVEAVENVWSWERNRGFSKIDFMYDILENEFFEYDVYNNDYSIKKNIHPNHFRPVSCKNVYWEALQADQLFEDYREGRLTGRLKEVAASLKEEDNPVIMLIRNKKLNIAATKY